MGRFKFSETTSTAHLVVALLIGGIGTLFWFLNEMVMELVSDFVQRGGWVMYPILFCSLCAVGLTLERIWALRRSKVLPRVFLESVSGLLDKQQYGQAAIISQDGQTPAARLVRLGLKMAATRQSVFKDAMEEAGRRESLDLFSHLSALGLVASISPLLGLLGTVSGMIRAFGVIAQEGMGNPGILAGGISEALLTTAAGLCVAIPALVAHRALVSRAGILTVELEDLGIDLMEALAAPEPVTNPSAPAAEEPPYELSERA